MADVHAGEVTRSLHKLKFGIRTDITERFATGDEPGRADQMIVKNGLGGYIEIKSAKTSFNFSDLRDNQREWIEQEAYANSKCRVWLWLFLGKNPPNYDPQKYLPRRAWLVEYWDWLAIEDVIKPIQNSLPYRAGKGYAKEMQGRCLDAETLLQGHVLTWSGAGVWTIDPTHPFASAFSL